MVLSVKCWGLVNVNTLSKLSSGTGTDPKLEPGSSILLETGWYRGTDFRLWSNTTLCFLRKKCFSPYSLWWSRMEAAYWQTYHRRAETGRDSWRSSCPSRATESQASPTIQGAVGASKQETPLSLPNLPGGLLYERMEFWVNAVFWSIMASCKGQAVWHLQCTAFEWGLKGLIGKCLEEAFEEPL